MTKSSVDRKRSRYGEKYSLRFHKKLKIYNLSCNGEIPSLIAKFVETDGDLAMDLFERLESNYKEIEQLKKDLDSISHNWALMYDEAKNKVEELSKENQKLKSINNQLEDRLEESGIGIALKMEHLND